MHRLNFLRRVFFNIWYYKTPPWDSGITPPELMAFIESHSPGKALDMGCGTGTNAITLSRLGWQVVGVDFAPKAIHQAKQKAKKNNVEVKFIVDDVSRLRKVTGEFDLIYDIGCFHNLSPIEKKAYLSRVIALLADSGNFLLYTFLADDASSQSTGITDEDIRAFLGPFNLINRQDGKDPNSCNSAWFHFRKSSDAS